MEKKNKASMLLYASIYSKFYLPCFRVPFQFCFYTFSKFLQELYLSIFLLETSVLYSSVEVITAVSLRNDQNSVFCISFHQALNF